MSEVLERALADLAEHPNSSALEISRRLGVLDDRRVFKALDLAAYDGKCQRTRTGNGPWRWEIPPTAGRAAAGSVRYVQLHIQTVLDPGEYRVLPNGRFRLSCIRCGELLETDSMDKDDPTPPHGCRTNQT